MDRGDWGCLLMGIWNALALFGLYIVGMLVWYFLKYGYLVL